MKHTIELKSEILNASKKVIIKANTVETAKTKAVRFNPDYKIVRVS